MMIWNTARGGGFRSPSLFLLALAWPAIVAAPAMAQTTTHFNATFTISDAGVQNTNTFGTNWLGTGAVGTLGNAVLRLNTTQALGQDGKSGVGQASAGLMLMFNRQDTITINTAGIPDPTAATITTIGRVGAGSGAYTGATGPAGGINLTLTRTSTTPPSYNLSLTGTATVGGQALNLAITNAPISQIRSIVNDIDNFAGNGTVTPGSNATLSGSAFGDESFVEVTVTVSFSAADTVSFFNTYTGEVPPPNTPVTITGGTGAYAGASGTGTLNFALVSGAETITMTGDITLPGPATPVITAVNTASGPLQIAANDWIEIKGNHLVPPDTVAGGLYWSNAPEFAQGKMPTQLGGVSATVNGKSAYVWWFCSKATTPACATDQINVLTPLDDTAGQVLVVVKNGTATSGAFLVRKTSASPSPLVFDLKGYATATHPDGKLVGPTTLYPGLSTPADRGETISLWAVGWGLPATPLVEGSATQSASMPSTPVCTLGGAPVQVAGALVTPGLYQWNVTIPNNAAAGDNLFYCWDPLVRGSAPSVSFSGTFTLPVLIAVR